MAEGGAKHIRIEYETRNCLIPYRSLEEFIKTCKEKFKIGSDEEIIFTVPGDDMEIDSGCIRDFPNNTHLQLKKANSDDRVSGLKEMKIAGESPKHIKIEYGQRKMLISYRWHDEFIETCKDKFSIGPAEEIIFTIPGDEMEIDSGCIRDFPNNTCLQLKTTTTYNGSSSDEEIDDYDLGSEEYVEETIEEIETFKWGDDKAFQKHLHSHEDENIAILLDESLKSWRMKKVNVAIIGQSGKGKSSLINALRGISDTDSNAAKVGEVETTNECTPFPHPKYAHIVYWDVPGCGTSNFPKDSYLEAINYQQYDYFLIVSTERFHELDIWLAQTLITEEKKDNCYFIRSKVDMDMTSIVKREKQPVTKKKESILLQKFKVEVKTGIAKIFGSKSFQLFLLSSHYPEKYEFQDLQQRLVEDALTEKRLSLAFGMNGLSKPLLDVKTKALRSRQWKLAAQLSSDLSLTTVFESDTHSLMPYLLPELQFYKEQLSLDFTGLQFVAKIAKTTIEKLKQDVHLKSDRPDVAIEKSLLKKFKFFFKSEKQSSLFNRIFSRSLKKRTASDAIRSVLDKQLTSYLIQTDKLIAYVKKRLEDDTK